MAIPVKNVQELYAAVHNKKHEGQVILLAPGTYTLDPVVDNSNAGRLELEENMELEGQVNHPELVIIDITALPDGSFAPPGGFPARTGAVRIGKGSNKLSWLTVMGKNDPTKKTALSVIDTDLSGKGSPHIIISHCIVTGGRIGINVRNVGAAHNGRNMVVELSNNILRQNLVSDPGTQQGQGIVLQHANGVSNATITATLNGNQVFGNIIGLRIFNNSNSLISATSDNTITVTSKNDIIVNNKLGIYFGGGLNTGGNQNLDRNTISFDAIHSIIQDNTGILPDSIVLPCGIFVTGASSAGGVNVASNNRVNITLTDCTLSGNQNVDIMAFGAFTRTNLPVAQPPNPALFPGTHNIVRIHRIGTSTASTKMQTNCFPPEVPPTNSVGIVP